MKNGDTYIKIIIALKKSSLSPKTRHMQAACHPEQERGGGGRRGDGGVKGISCCGGKHSHPIISMQSKQTEAA